MIDLVSPISLCCRREPVQTRINSVWAPFIDGDGCHVCSHCGKPAEFEQDSLEDPHLDRDGEEGGDETYDREMQQP